MKVKELIEKLKEFDENLEVGFEDCDAGGLYGTYEKDITAELVKDEDGEEIVAITLG